MQDFCFTKPSNPKKNIVDDDLNMILRDNYVTFNNFLQVRTDELHNNK